MPTAARVLLITIIVGAVLIWGGVGYLWLNQQNQSSLLPLTRSLSSLPLISSFVPTTAPSPLTTPPLPTLSGSLSTFTDPEYNFSFDYPADLRMVKVKSPREKLLEFARANYRPLPTEVGLESRPTPSLETTLPILKQYSAVGSTNPEIGLIDVSVVEGSYQDQVETAQEMARFFNQEDLEEEGPSFYQVRAGSGRLISVLALPYSGDGTYRVAYYPLGEDRYLMVEIQPELLQVYSEITDEILASVQVPQ